MRILSLAFALLAATLVTTAWSNDEPWKLEKDKDGIQVYTRAVDGWSIREIRGIVRLPARLSSAVAVVCDVAAAHELNDVIAAAEVRQRDSDTRYQVYSSMKMPWPINDREILNQREITQDESTLAVTVTDIAIEDQAPPKKGVVRIVKSRQQWIVTPGQDGQVTVEMRALTDPAGPIPAPIVNTMSVGAPFKTMSKLKELVQRPEYQRAKLPFIKDAAGAS